MNILLAIKWIKEALDEFGPDTIRNCFRQCGTIPDVEHQIERELSDPFSDLDVTVTCTHWMTFYLRWTVA